MNKRKLFFFTSLLFTSFLVSGCLKTSIKTEKLVPAEYAAGAKLRSVAVLPFTEGRNRDNESTSEIRATVTGIRIDGKKYFTVVERARLAEILAEQSNYRTGQFDNRSAVAIGKKLNTQSVLYGEIQESNLTRSEGYQTKDGKTCYTHGYTYRFIPRFINVRTGVVEFEKKISERATINICGSARPDKLSLVNEARSSAMKEFRRLIAPYKVSESLELLTKYCKPASGGAFKRKLNDITNSQCDATYPSDLVLAKVEGGADFADANRMDRACKLWKEAAQLHTDGYNIPYLIGVCAEVYESNLAKAKRQYQIADERTLGPVSQINKALRRIDRKLGQTGSAATRKVAKKPSPLIMNAQKALVSLGYDPGPVDGFSGSRTVAAIKEFQLDNGLESSGQLDSQTKQILGI